MSVAIGRCIGRGYEGTVHQTNIPGTVAKIFKKTPSQDTWEKLLYMVENPPEWPLREHVSWPTALLTRGGQAEGFLMPRMKGAPLVDLLHVDTRMKHFPHFTWKDLHEIAASLALIVATLIEGKDTYVACDLKPQNVIATFDRRDKKWRASLIDVTSFQVESSSGVLFNSSIATEKYMQPSSIGRDLLEPRHHLYDLWALAVIVYECLNFSFPLIGGGRIDEVITRGDWAGDRLHNLPPHVIPPDISSRPVYSCLTHYFTSGRVDPLARPNADDLHERLAGGSFLTPCGEHPNHVFWPAEPCYWCKSRSLGREYFPDPVGYRGAA